MLFSWCNTLKLKQLLGVSLMIGLVYAPQIIAQEDSPSAELLQNDPITDNKPSETVAISTLPDTLNQITQNTPQRDEIFKALSALSAKYKAIAERIPLVPLLKDPSSRFEDGEALIFSIIVDNLKLGDMYGYKQGSGMRFGLNEFATILEFNIKPNDDFTQFDGWYIKEENTFSLSLNNLELTQEVSSDVSLDSAEALPMDDDTNNITTSVDVSLIDQRFELPQEHYQTDFDDLYIDLDHLGRWFGIDVEYDFIDLKIYLYPTTKLPIQTRIARRKKVAFSSSDKESQFSLQDNEYQLLSPQAVDLSINARRSENNNTQNYSIVGARDFAYMRGELYASGSNNKVLQQARVKFSRGTLAKPMFNGVITEFSLGDISPIRQSNSSIGGLTRGISFSNQTTTDQNINVTSFKGNIQQGWDVELYRNGILIDSIFDVQDGRYDFDDVQLYFGTNEFELVFYGPQGEIRKEKIEKLVDAASLDIGGTYSFSLNDLDNTMLNISESNSNAGYLAAGSYQNRLTDTISYRASLSNQFGGAQDVQSGFLSLNGQLFNKLLWNTTYSEDSLNRTQLSGNLRSEFAGQTFLLGVNRNVSNVNNAITDRPQSVSSHNYQIDVSGNIPQQLLGTFPNINYKSSFRRQQTSLGASNIDFLQSFSSRLFDTSVNVAFNYNTFNTTEGESDDSSSLSLNLQRSIGEAFVNLQTNFDVSTQQLNNISSQISYSFTDNLKSRFRLSHNPGDNLNTYFMNVYWKHDDFYLTSEYSYSDIAGWQLGLGLRFGLGFVNDSHDFIVDRSSMTSSGTVVANVFLDNNFNGVFDSGDFVLSDVEVNAVQARRKVKSDTRGVALLNRLPNNKITDITVNRKSLPDPYMIVSQPPFAVRSRSGYIEEVNLPVVFTSEIDGVITLVNEYGNLQQVSYAPIQLVDADGEVLATVTSEFDGYYLIMDVKPGQYQVRIAPDYVASNNLVNSKPLNIVMSHSGELSSGNDFTLFQRQFEERYVVTVGEFSDADVLNAYWSVLQRQNPNVLSAYSAFYLPPTDNQKYRLGLGMYNEVFDADDACLALQNTGINCEVIDYTVEISQGKLNET